MPETIFKGISDLKIASKKPMRKPGKVPSRPQLTRLVLYQLYRLILSSKSLGASPEGWCVRCAGARSS